MVCSLASLSPHLIEDKAVTSAFNLGSYPMSKVRGTKPTLCACVLAASRLVFTGEAQGGSSSFLHHDEMFISLLVSLLLGDGPAEDHLN